MFEHYWEIMWYSIRPDMYCLDSLDFTKEHYLVFVPNLSCPQESYREIRQVDSITNWAAFCEKVQDCIWDVIEWFDYNDAFNVRLINNPFPIPVILTTNWNTISISVAWNTPVTENIILSNALTGAWLNIISTVNWVAASKDLWPSVQALINANTDAVTNTIAWHLIASHTSVDNQIVDINETITSLQTPTLAGNVLTIPFKNETWSTQSVTVNLGSLAPINDINISNATYSAAANIITLTENNWDVYTIDLSEFSIITNTLPNGDIQVTQEWVTKFVIPKDLSTLTCNWAPVSATNKILTTGSLSSNVDLPTNILDNSVDLNKRYKKTIKVNTWCSDDEYYETCPCWWYFMTLKRQNIWFRVFLLWFWPWWNSPLFWDTWNINEQPRYEPTTWTIYWYDANIISTWNTFRQFVEYCVSFIPQSYWANIINVLHWWSDNATILIKFKSIEWWLMWFFWESIFIADRDCCEPQIQWERFTTQPDYNNNDTTSPNYIANKPPILLANNGLDLDGANVVLWQDVWEAWDPAKLLNDREIPMDGKHITLKASNGDITKFNWIDWEVNVWWRRIGINENWTDDIWTVYSRWVIWLKGNQVNRNVWREPNWVNLWERFVSQWYEYPTNSAWTIVAYQPTFQSVWEWLDTTPTQIVALDSISSDYRLWYNSAWFSWHLPPISSSATVESLAIDTANGQILRTVNSWVSWFFVTWGTALWWVSTTMSTFSLTLNRTANVMICYRHNFASSNWWFYNIELWNNWTIIFPWFPESTWFPPSIYAEDNVQRSFAITLGAWLNNMEIKIIPNVDINLQNQWFWHILYTYK